MHPRPTSRGNMPCSCAGAASWFEACEYCKGYPDMSTLKKDDPVEVTVMGNVANDPTPGTGVVIVRVHGLGEMLFRLDQVRPAFQDCPETPARGPEEAGTILDTLEKARAEFAALPAHIREQAERNRQVRIYADREDRPNEGPAVDWKERHGIAVRERNDYHRRLVAAENELERLRRESAQPSYERGYQAAIDDAVQIARAVGADDSILDEASEIAKRVREQGRRMPASPSSSAGEKP